MALPPIKEEVIAERSLPAGDSFNDLISHDAAGDGTHRIQFRLPLHTQAPGQEISWRALSDEKEWSKEGRKERVRERKTENVIKGRRKIMT